MKKLSGDIMIKDKIAKNLSDAEMFKNYKEELTFENNTAEAEPPSKPVKRTTDAGKKAEDINTAFFTPELQQQIGKALLELKLQLFKEGLVDYNLKVTREGRRIILTAVETVTKTKK